MPIFGEAASPFDEIVEKATCETATTENWSLFMDITDRVNADPRAAKLALTSIRKRLNHRDPHVVLLALAVLDSCWCNCGVVFRREVSSASFINELSSKCTHSVRLIASKSRALLRKWVRTECSADTSLALVSTLYKNLVVDGVEFEEDEPRKKNPVSNDPNAVTSQEEEDAIMRAIALSLDDQKDNKRGGGGGGGSSSLYPSTNGGGGVSLGNGVGGAGAGNAPAQSRPEREVRALYDFEAAEDNELSFVTGDIITVTDDSNANWWKGRLGAAHGLFPSSFVSDDTSAPVETPVIAPVVATPAAPAVHIDEQQLLRCIELLEECDPTGECEDSDELLQTEASVRAQAVLIDEKLASLDRRANQLAQIDMSVRDALAMYDSAIQQAMMYQQSARFVPPGQPPQPHVGHPGMAATAALHQAQHHHMTQGQPQGQGHYPQAAHQQYAQHSQQAAQHQQQYYQQSSMPPQMGYAAPAADWQQQSQQAAPQQY